LFCSIEGIHPESVPSGLDVLQLVVNKTDDPTEGMEMGPEHWVLVQNPQELYEPESYPVMQDHGHIVTNQLPNNPPPPTNNPPPPNNPQATKKADKDKKKRELYYKKVEG
jgi:hypothetical protein